MQQYRAFKIKLENETETFSLMPLNKDCLFTEGYFVLSANKLLLISEKSSEKFKLIEKFNPDGTFKLIKGIPEVERLRISQEIIYELIDEDLNWFIENFVQNKEFTQSIITKLNSKIIPAHTLENLERNSL